MRIAAALVFLLCVVACGHDAPPPCLDRVAPAPDGDYVRSVGVEGHQRVVEEPTDGRRLRIPLDPRRVVSTLPGLTEIVASLGALDRLVAVSPHCDRPLEVADLPRLSVMPLDRERLIALAPDLVLVDSVVRVDGLETPDGPPVLPLESRTLAHLRRTVELLAEVFDTEAARGGAVRFRVALELAYTAIAHDAKGPPPRVLLVAQSEPLYVLGPGSLLDDMLRACGAVNVACDLGRPSGPFAEELVLARRPDWILGLDGRPDDRLLRRWDSLDAVREGRIATGAADDLLRAGPRTPPALIRLADVLHGRRAPDELEGVR